MQAERPPSLRSVASNASLGSTVSLTRRARTRIRSKTSPRPDVTAFQPPISPPLPTLEPQLYGAYMVEEPAEMASAMHEKDQGDTLSVHSEGETKHSKAAAHALRLPGISANNQARAPLPSAFSRVPSIPQLYDLRGNNNARDSVFTQGSGFSQSGGSSSIYPASTSTASGTESPPSPQSIAEQVDNNDVASFDPELDQEYDGDDVQYRLRLLVTNNYRLPPAHQKPEFTQSRPPPTTPTFFDLFRKSRSKPSTPTGSAQAFDLYSPALRTTSDSTTVSAYPTSRRPSASSPAPPRPGAPQDPSGRVVVVREKMHDIATAARQAEQEMKMRGARQEEVVGAHSEVEVIDPTDAVDLPPPSPAYPFAVQASALHEMGVQESVGAALLADRLPPRSPVSLVEDEWRKALLHAAVNHSMNNSLSSPASSPASDKRMLGKRIMSPPLVDEPQTSGPSIDGPSDAGEVGPRPPSCLPSRVETPLMPMTPLPPPRRLVNPLYSISQTSLPIDVSALRSPSSAGDRNIEPTPRLSDSYEAGIRDTMLSPPPVIRESSEDSRPRASSDSNASFYSEPESEKPRRSSTSSSIPENRPSLSIYSQPSPTTSAFQDAILYPPVLNPPARGSSLRQSLEQHVSSSSSPVPRDSMASPPPRVSSSMAHFTPLPPPPRSSSLGRRMMNASSRMAPSVPPLLPNSPEILDPGPSTPPFPLSDRRGLTPLVLEIPQTTAEPSIRSAPPPSSPPSFFDSIQNQPNAMDDLDSSSDEESYQGDPEPPQTPVFVERRARATSNAPASVSSSSRSLLMRLGNHSTPYVSRSTGNSPVSSKKAVGNIPVAASFFTERRAKGGKSDQGHGPPTSTFDFFKYTQQHPLVPVTMAEPSTAIPPRRPHTTEQTHTVRSWQMNQTAQESQRRLDGMLIQHMEAEKDTIRRIATTLQSNLRSNA
ncbi:hypothetical protein DFH06DRAFT_1335860 [Mycena polygramma]|nr:hypothetical protein DFH06DRAFT_1335860 [Mycena polygramma]